jgi:addiction module RelB/DinJ family antitoxin
MSDTTLISVRTDSEVKAKAQKLAKKLGLNLSSVINAYLRQFVRTKSVSFSLKAAPSEYLLKSLAESKNDIEKGYISPVFDNANKALKWLKKPKKKYANQL